MFKLRGLITLIILVGLIWVFSLSPVEPKLNSNWTTDQAKLATIEITGDTVNLTDVRNFTYRSETDYTPVYYDTTVKLSDLERVDYIVEPFGSIGAAHTFVTFVFTDGQYISISVETRREIGEKFSPLLGLLRQFELIYVIANEKDVIDLRANYRHHTVYLYPTTLTKEEGQRLFVAMLERAKKLKTEPEFYNTITNNCTTNIAEYVEEIRPQKAITHYDYRLVLTGKSDALALELGLLDTELPLKEAQAKYQINDLALKASGSLDFSKIIRGLESTSSSQEVNSESKEITAKSYRVSKVIDGDTIEVFDEAGVNHLVRYIGIDTPEIDHGKDESECLAIEASASNAKLVAGKTVNLTKDISDVDKYGRWLRYVTVDGIDVGRQLLLTGYAKVLSIPPDLARKDDYKVARDTAKDNNLGLWGTACATQS